MSHLELLEMEKNCGGVSDSILDNSHLGDDYEKIEV
jgi:hypothetical protein